jgi:hypothetical protein
MAGTIGRRCLAPRLQNVRGRAVSRRETSTDEKKFGTTVTTESLAATQRVLHKRARREPGFTLHNGDFICTSWLMVEKPPG